MANVIQNLAGQTSVTLYANGDLTGKKTFPVNVVSGTDFRVEVATASADLTIGVLMSEADAAGEPVEVTTFGPVVKMEVGTGGVTRGTRVKVVSDGVADWDPSSGDGHDHAGADATPPEEIVPAIGIALNSASAGKVASIVLCTVAF